MLYKKIQECHFSLLKNREKLEYIIEKQHLSVEIIKKFLVGFDGKYYTIPIFDYDEAFMGFKYYNPFPNITNNPRKYFFSQGVKKRIYNFNSLNLERKLVVITGGEFKVMVLDSLGFPAVCLTTGEKSKIPETDIEQFHGKNVYIIMDNDMTGDEGAVSIAKQLHKVASTHIVKWPPNAPRKCDPNEWLRLGNSVQSLKDIMKAGELYKPEKIIDYDYNIVEVADFYSDIVVVGENDDNTIMLFSKKTRRYWNINLNSLNSLEVIRMTGIDPESKSKKFALHKLKKAVAYQCIGKYTSYYKHRGQGIWKYKDKLLILNGGMAYIRTPDDAGKLNKLILDNKLFLKYDNNDMWMVDEWVKDMNPKDGKDIYNRLETIVQKWQFKNEKNIKLLCGLIMACPFQTIWDWRPHIFITGRFQTGKTLFFSFLNNLFNELCFTNEGRITEAAVRQSINSSAKIPLFDEFEKGRQAILNLIRASNRGATIRRGTASQKAIIFELHQMFWLAAIDFGVKEGADVSRFFKVELVKPKGVFIPPDYEEVQELFKDILVYGFNNYHKYLEVTEKIYRMESDINRRSLECLSVPVSVLSVMLNEDYSNLIEYFAELVRQRDTVDDSNRLLDDILTSKLSFPLDKQRIDASVGKILVDEYMYSGAKHTLEANGIFRYSYKRQSGIMLVPSIIHRYLLRDTNDWKDMAIREILLRHRDIKEIRYKEDNKRKSALWMPLGYKMQEDIYSDDEEIPY